jgi:hypothetical protein
MEVLAEIKRWIELELNVDDLSSASREARYIAGKALYIMVTDTFTSLTDEVKSEELGKNRSLCSHYRANMHVLKDRFPYIEKLFAKYKQAYRFLIHNVNIADYPFDIYEALKYQMELNNKMERQLLNSMLVNNIERVNPVYGTTKQKFESKLSELTEEQVEMVYERMIPIVTMAKSAKYYKVNLDS